MIDALDRSKSALPLSAAVKCLLCSVEVWHVLVDTDTGYRRLTTPIDRRFGCDHDHGLLAEVRLAAGGVVDLPVCNRCAPTVHLLELWRRAVEAWPPLGPRGPILLTLEDGEPALRIHRWGE